FERDKNNRRVLARRSYNLYSDVQKGENVVVEIPVQAGEKHFKGPQLEPLFPTLLKEKWQSRVIKPLSLPLYLDASESSLILISVP
ncbi:DUF961 family protein, partial [Clostridioides difficile]